jgi:hypothetical protein
MAPVTPYSAVLGDRDPLIAMRETVERVQAITGSWKDEDFERSYAPGKWTARLILTHLAQSELAFGNRTRMALSAPGYVAQPFDQDAWMRREQSLSGPDAAAAFVTLARLNAALYAGLTPADRQQPFAHPEYGTLTVDWVVHQSAGHMLHHLKQLDAI